MQEPTAYCPNCDRQHTTEQPEQVVCECGTVLETEELNFEE